MADDIRLNVNGTTHVISDVAQRTLLDVLRSDLCLTGTKYGCGMAQCGACTVLVDHMPARSCVLRARRVGNRPVTTLEGLCDPVTGSLSAVQQAFLECEGAQCGYCLNGMVMTTVALLSVNPSPTRSEIREALRHNLCRCGTHVEIIASVERAAKLLQSRSDG